MECVAQRNRCGRFLLSHRNCANRQTQVHRVALHRTLDRLTSGYWGLSLIEHSSRYGLAWLGFALLPVKKECFHQHTSTLLELSPLLRPPFFKTMATRPQPN